MQDPKLFEILQKSTWVNKIHPKQIKLEITERVFISGNFVYDWISKCRNKGYSVALDDFGTGYSSLSSLHKIDANNIAGLIPFSGQTITHFTVRAEQDIPGEQPIIDSLAPLFHIRKDAPPLLLITGDRELELLGRYEENAYLMRMMKVIGHKETVLYEMDGYGHSMTHPAFPLLIKEVRKISKK
jgi:hypothetical protein